MGSAIAVYNLISASVNHIDDVISTHAPMVKKIAYHLTARLPANIQVDDLIQAGMIGLLEAAKNFDASKGASFETYAGIRIRGMMLDEVRKMDWVPRSVHRNGRMIAQKIREIENVSGRDARDNEVAEALGISIADYHQMLVDMTGTRLFTLEDLALHGEELTVSDAPIHSDPAVGFELDDIRKLVAKGISQLPDREKLVVALYYEEELNLKEIGEVLGVSESRICQIHSQAMIRLQARVSDNS